MIRLSLAALTLVTVFAFAGRVAGTVWAAPFGVAVVAAAVLLTWLDRPVSLERYERRTR